MSSNGKPTPQPAAAGAGTGGPPKMYQRPIYRPQQAAAKRRRGGRSCPFSCCCCFCWTVLAIVLVAVLAAVAGGAFYLLYRPHRPAFTLTAARVTRLSLSPSATAPALSDAIDVTLTARNPNKKLVYVYDDFAVTAATAANAVPLGAGTAPGFAHEAGNVTVIRATVSASALAVDPAAAGSDVRRSGEFPIVLDLETRAGVRVGALRTKKIGILVHCDGVKVAAPAPAPAKGKKKLAKAAADAPAPAAAVDDAPAPPAAAATTTVARACQVRVRVKIWKWTF